MEMLEIAIMYFANEPKYILILSLKMTYLGSFREFADLLLSLKFLHLSILLTVQKNIKHRFVRNQ